MLDLGIGGGRPRPDLVKAAMNHGPDVDFGVRPNGSGMVDLD
jgi:hypothetical protein